MGLGSLEQDHQDQMIVSDLPMPAARPAFRHECSARGWRPVPSASGTQQACNRALISRAWAVASAAMIVANIPAYANPAMAMPSQARLSRTEQQQCDPQSSSE